MKGAVKIVSNYGKLFSTQNPSNSTVVHVVDILGLIFYVKLLLVSHDYSSVNYFYYLIRRKALEM